jgi:phage terminase large subunit-like protein
MPKISVLEAYHVRLSFPDKIALVNHLNRHHKPEFIVVELAAGGRELAEYMVKHHAVPLRGIKPHGANKGVRLDSITPFLEGGIVRFSPRIVNPPDATYVHDRGDLSAELSGFPLYPTDDILDAFTHLMRFVTVAYEVFSDEDALAAASEDKLLTDEMVDPFGDDEPDEDEGDGSSVLLI